MAPYSMIYPEYTVEQARNDTQLIAEFTTYFKGSTYGKENRVRNIVKASGLIDKCVIDPGDIFSINQVLGERNEKNGWSVAAGIKDGAYVQEYGGGVCQVSSTIFECILRANLQVVSRAPHSLEISYVPLGGDATVQWNTTDFQFKNTSGTDIRLQMTAKNGTLTCKVMGQKNVKPKDVKISIKKTGKQYVLTRTVGGKVNYTTYSTYAKPKKSQ